MILKTKTIFVNSSINSIKFYSLKTIKNKYFLMFISNHFFKINYDIFILFILLKILISQ